MKKKIFYLPVLILCMCFFSSARQNGSIADNDSPCRPGKLKCTKQPQPERKNTGFDWSPLQLFTI
jgi:hypothetical protein